MKVAKLAAFCSFLQKKVLLFGSWDLKTLDLSHNMVYYINMLKCGILYRNLTNYYTKEDDKNVTCLILK